MLINVNMMLIIHFFLDFFLKIEKYNTFAIRKIIYISY